MNHHQQPRNQDRRSQDHHYDYHIMTNGSSDIMQNANAIYNNNYGAHHGSSSLAVATCSPINEFNGGGGGQSSFDYSFPPAQQQQNYQWESSPPPSYYQDQNYHRQSYYASTPLYDQTPPPELLLNGLMHQQQPQNNNDKYLDPYNGGHNSNMIYNSSPLSPMSMQSTESFENGSLLSPRSNDATSTSLSNTVYYINDVQSTPAEYIEHQYQLQHQYQAQQQQRHYQEYATNESFYSSSDYDSQHHYDNHRSSSIQQPHPPQHEITKSSNTSRRQKKQQQQELAESENETTTTVAKPTTKQHLNNSDRKTATPIVRNKQKNPRKRRITLAQLQCPTCFKIFSRPYNLKSHQKTHTKERPFACLVPGCHWTFARPHDLKRHDVSLHTGIKPYGCPCGKRFARSDAFKRHQAVDSFCSSSSGSTTTRRFAGHM